MYLAAFLSYGKVLKSRSKRMAEGNSSYALPYETLSWQNKRRQTCLQTRQRYIFDPAKAVTVM